MNKPPAAPAGVASKQLSPQTQAPNRELMSPKDLIDQKELIQSVMKQVMKKDVHYGVVPGTRGLSLMKAGTEVLLNTFRIAVIPAVTDLSSDHHVHYRVVAKGVAIQTGLVIGEGIGECSSREEKYLWRDCSEAEFHAAHVSRRRMKFYTPWGNDGRPQPERQKCQVMNNPYDKANTILKMAKKRAQVDLCLTALAASDIFENEQTGTSSAARNTSYQQKPRSEPGKQFLTSSQINMLKSKTSSTGISMEDICKFVGVSDVEKIPFDRFNDIQKHIKQTNQDLMRAETDGK